MNENMKDNILNTGGDPPETGGVDFSNMSDEELMKMDISDIFLEDLDRFLAEKEVRLSRREMMEARAEELNGSKRSPAAVNEAAAEPAESEKPAESAEAAETTEPAESPETGETADSTASEDAAESAEPAESENVAETTEPAESEKPAVCADAAEITEPVESEEPAETAEPVESEKPAETAEPVESENSAETTESAVSVATAAGAAQPTAVPAGGGPGYVLPPPASDTPEQKQKKKPGIAALIFVGSLLCCAIIAIAAAYFYYADYFSKRFFPGTIINERDVSVLEPAQVKQDIANDIVTYRLDIKELNDVTETITSEDIALAYVDDGAVDKILEEQDTKFWFLRLLGTKTYEVSTGTTYDREKAEQVVSGLSCLKPENITAPVDAQLVDNGTSFSIQPEVEGNQLDEEKFRTLVFDALDSGKTEVDVVADDCYLHPSVRSDNENLNTRMNEYNAILGVNVYYVFGENTEYVNADTLRPFTASSRLIPARSSCFPKAEITDGSLTRMSPSPMFGTPWRRRQPARERRPSSTAPWGGTTAISPEPMLRSASLSSISGATIIMSLSWIRTSSPVFRHRSGRRGEVSMRSMQRKNTRHWEDWMFRDMRHLSTTGLRSTEAAACMTRRGEAHSAETSICTTVPTAVSISRRRTWQRYSMLSRSATRSLFTKHKRRVI